MSADGSPVSLRLARAFAGMSVADAEASPPLVWTGTGSVAMRAAFRAADAARSSLNFLDAIGRAMAARPVLLVAAAIIAAPVSHIVGVAWIGVVAFALAGTSVVLAVAHRLHDGVERSIVVRALLVGMSLRLAFAAVISAQGGFPDETGTYHPIGAAAAEGWRSGETDVLASNVIVEGRAAYFHLLSALYFVFGPSMAVARALGAILGIGAALAAGEVGRALGGRRAAAFAVVLLAIHPEHAFWSATIARDTLTTLLVLVTFAVVLGRPGKLLRGNLLLAAVPVALLTMNSFIVAGALGATLAVMTLSEAIVGAGSGARRVATGLIAVAVAAAALVFVGHRFGAWMTPSMLATVRGNAAGSAADFLPQLEFANWWSVAAYVPIGMALVLGAPWPWTAVHANRVAYGVMALAGLAILTAGVLGLVASARRRPTAAAPIVLFCLLLVLILAVLEGNSGIVVRHRLPLTACLCAAAGALFAGLRRQA